MPQRRAFRALVAAAIAVSSLLMIGAPAWAGQWTGYVTRTDPNVLLPFDTASGETGAPIPSISTPRGLTISPDGKTAYMTANGPSRIVPVSLPSGHHGEPIPVPGPVSGLAITPDGSSLYAISTNVGFIYRIDTATREVHPPIEVGSQVWGIAVTPDGRSLYITTGSYPSFPSSFAGVARVDIASGAVTEVGDTDAAMNDIGILPDGSSAYAMASGRNRAYQVQGDQIVSDFAAGSQVSDIAISPDGRLGLAVNFAYDQVTVLDLAANATGITIPVGDYPVGVAISPDSKTGYVTAKDGESITPIDLQTLTAGIPIPAGGPAWEIAITPNQPPTADFTAGEARPGAPVRLDASASVDPDGQVARYRWDFGDGGTVETSEPVVSHTYAAEGDYTAKLTLTDDVGCSTEIVFTGKIASCGGGPKAVHEATIRVAEPPFCQVHPDDPRCDKGGGGDGGGDGGGGGNGDGGGNGGGGEGQAGPARLGQLKVKPKKRKLRRGGRAVFKVRIKNVGRRPARKLRVCAKPKPKRGVVRVRRCARRKALAPGKTARFRFVVRRGKRAKAGRRVKIRFTATAAGLAKRHAAAKVIVR